MVTKHQVVSKPAFLVEDNAAELHQAESIATAFQAVDKSTAFQAVDKSTEQHQAVSMATAYQVEGKAAAFQAVDKAITFQAVDNSVVMDKPYYRTVAGFQVVHRVKFAQVDLEADIVVASFLANQSFVVKVASLAIPGKVIGEIEVALSAIIMADS